MLLLPLYASTLKGGVAESPAAFLKRVEAKVAALHGVNADVVETHTWMRQDGSELKTTHQETTQLTLAYARPNRFAIVSKDASRPVTSSTISDGKVLHNVYGNQFSNGEISADARSYHWYHDDLMLFYVTGSLKGAIDPPYAPSLKMLPNEDWNGENFKVLGIHVGGGVPIDYKLYVDANGYPRRMTHHEWDKDHGFDWESAITKLTPNPAFTAETFAFNPGPELKEAPKIDYYKDNPLIKVGQTATDFFLEKPTGGRLSLKGEMAGKKAMLLNFWFVGCPPCRAEHPKLQKFYNDLKGKGLGLVAIDDQDSGERVARYLRDAKLSFPTVLTGPMYAKDPKTGQPQYGGPKMPDYASLTPYGVHECPTNVLLDENMKVVYVGLEWNEAELRNKLSELGVK